MVNLLWVHGHDSLAKPDNKKPPEPPGVAGCLIRIMAPVACWTKKGLQFGSNTRENMRGIVYDTASMRASIATAFAELPSGNLTYLLNIAIEIVSFHIESGDFP